jgi:hypothetical protein
VREDAAEAVARLTGSQPSRNAGLVAGEDHLGACGAAEFGGRGLGGHRRGHQSETRWPEGASSALRDQFSPRRRVSSRSGAPGRCGMPGLPTIVVAVTHSSLMTVVHPAGTRAPVPIRIASPCRNGPARLVPATWMSGRTIQGPLPRTA